MKRVVDKLDGLIDTHGWAVIAVFPTTEDECWFAYTVGLAAKGLPEIILTGLPQEMAQPLLNGLARRLIDGEAIDTDTPLERVLAGSFKPVLKAIPRNQADDYMMGAKARYPQYRALQLFWPDDSGRMPWEPGTSPRFRASQRDLRAAH